VTVTGNLTDQEEGLLLILFFLHGKPQDKVNNRYESGFTATIQRIFHILHGMTPMQGCQHPITAGLSSKGQAGIGTVGGDELKTPSCNKLWPDFTRESTEEDVTPERPEEALDLLPARSPSIRAVGEGIWAYQANIPVFPGISYNCIDAAVPHPVPKYTRGLAVPTPVRTSAGDLDVPFNGGKRRKSVENHGMIQGTISILGGNTTGDIPPPCFKVRKEGRQGFLALTHNHVICEHGNLTVTSRGVRSADDGNTGGSGDLILVPGIIE
jgi:hypothetical protein